jgi:hypothetical protein
MFGLFSALFNIHLQWKKAPQLDWDKLVCKDTINLRMEGTPSGVCKNDRPLQEVN